MKTILAFARAAIGSNTEYRGAIVIWMISSLIRIVVALSIWLSASNVLVGGYTKAGIVNYYVVAMFFEWILLWNPFYPISQEIKSGQIMTYLVRPLSYFLSWLGRETGFKVVAIFLLSLIGTPLLVILGSVGLPLNLQIDSSWLFLLVAIPGAILISFLVTMCMATLGFWLTEVKYVNYVYWTFMPLLGGLFLPTSFFPMALERINRLLLFRYQFSFPLEILLHKLSFSETIFSLIIMFVWIILLAWLYKKLWREGVKAYAAFGQ